MMQVEKWITYLILSFILTIALFNVVGSLSMLMIEKKDDVHTLRNMGADNKLIRRIFLFEGWMISGFGALIGIVIGLALCFLQRQFGLIKLGQTAGAFIIDAYPVRVMFTDALIAFITVAAIGFMAAWYPVHYLGKKWFN
jgi:lipoprotein-releasing system permease protein